MMTKIISKTNSIGRLKQLIVDSARLARLLLRWSREVAVGYLKPDDGSLLRTADTVSNESLIY